MARTRNVIAKVSAAAEHRRNEAHIEALLNLHARAPARIRGRAEWERALPPSRLPRPDDSAGYLAQAEERSREAAESLRKPLSCYLLPFFVARRMQRLRDKEAARVSSLARLLGGDPAAVAAAVQDAFTRLSLPFAIGVRVACTARGALKVEIDLPGDNVIPKERSSLTKTGRISYRNWPERDRNETYARAVAALALLLGAAALDAAPSLGAIIVSGVIPAVDPRTGRDTVACLVSARLRRDTLAALRLDRTDPIAALENFEHRLDPGRGAALRPVTPLEEEPEEALAGAGGQMPSAGRRKLRRAAASARDTRAPAAPEAPFERELAADALRLAIACARSDGRFDAAEIAAIGRMLEDRFAPDALERKRLDLLREELAGAPIDVARAAQRLRERLAPLERQLLIEGILAALREKGAAADAELRLLENVAAKLDISSVAVNDMRQRAAPAASTPETDREQWLAALELPGDVKLARALIERTAARILDTYAEERFASLGSDFQAMAGQRRDGAAAARRGLLDLLPPEERRDAPQAPPPPSDSSAPRRDNPDLDAIFGN
ncbi:MAG TPA: hypothetical protein DCM87_10220 [Planctomycetes bacterium]|nr:hypothetical protein [Planctomycetota bacterium]